MGFYEELIGVIASSYQASSTWTMVLSTSGTGTATSRLVMYAASATTATLDGTGRFYSDSAGTSNESTTWNLAAGWNTIYAKVPSGSSNLLFADRARITKWGQSGATAYQGWTPQTNSPSLAVSLNDMNGLASIRWGGSVLLSGFWSSLADTCAYFVVSVAAGSTCSGTWTLSPSVTYVSLASTTSSVGLSVGAASSLTYLNTAGSSFVITGSVSALTACTTIQCATGVSFNCSGDLSALSALTVLYAPTGSSTLTYPTASGTHSWPAGMNQIYLRSQTLPTASIVALLADLAAQSVWTGNKVVNLKAINSSEAASAQTSAAAAISSLQGNGVAVTVST